MVKPNKNTKNFRGGRIRIYPPIGDPCKMQNVSLSEGTPVRLTGLRTKNTASLNGAIGRVVSLHQPSGRFHVRLALPKAQAGTTWLLEGANLRVVNQTFEEWVATTQSDDSPRDSLVRQSVAIQVSGYLGVACDLDNIKLHLRACRARLERCLLFLHSWAELEPQTPHWNGLRMRPRVPSDQCVSRARMALSPLRVLVEEQPPPPSTNGRNDTSALAPDGQPFQIGSSSAERMRFWGSARHHGWQMNLLGMQRASTLRREYVRQSGRDVSFAVRLRPDEPRGAPKVHTAERIAQLWNGIELLLLGKNWVPPPPPRRNEPRLAESVRARTSGDLSALNASRVMSTCTSRGFQYYAFDNCMFGSPEALDRLLDVFEDPNRYAQVYAALRRQRGPHTEYIPEQQLIHAANIEGIRLTALCHPDAVAALSELVVLSHEAPLAVRDRFVCVTSRMADATARGVMGDALIVAPNATCP